MWQASSVPIAVMNLAESVNSLLKFLNIALRQSPFCHSIPERCFVYHNRHLPICARCTGIVVGGMISLLIFNIFNIYLDYRIIIILAIPMIIDGGLQYLNYIPSNNNRRFITGIMFGIGTAIFSRNIADFIFSAIFIL